MRGTVRALHQFVPTVEGGDPFTVHAFRVRDALREAGLASDVFVEARSPDLVAETLPVHDYVEHTRRARHDCAGLLYQMHGAATCAELFFALPERKVVHYHAVTPPGAYAGWDDLEMMRSRVHATQVDRLARRVDLALADTPWEAAELEAHGYRCPRAVVPMLVGPADVAAPPDERLLARLVRAGRSGAGRWLCAGRLAPQGGHHDVVRAFALGVAAAGDGEARLALVGEEGSSRYVDALRAFVARLGLEEAVEVVVGPTPAARAAHYRAADVVVSLARHEGFSLRLLEALHHGVPVVAHAVAGIPGTVGDAALLLPEGDLLAVALAAERVRDDAALAGRLRDAGRRRVEELAPERTRRVLVDALAPVLEPAA